MKNTQNPFKKKRGEGYIPVTADQVNEDQQPVESLATFSLLNQNKQTENKNKNDAVVAGTFGGANGMFNAPEQVIRTSVNNDNKQSFYQKSPSN